MTRRKEEPSDSLFDALTSSREQVRELTDQLGEARKKLRSLTKDLEESSTRVQNLDQLGAKTTFQRNVLALVLVVALVYVVYVGQDEPPIASSNDRVAASIGMFQVNLMHDVAFRDSVALSAIDRYRQGNETLALERVRTCSDDALKIPAEQFGKVFAALWACRVEDVTYGWIQIIRKEQKGVEPHLLLSKPIQDARLLKMMNGIAELTLFFEIETDALEGLEDLVRDQVRFVQQ